MSLPLAIMSSGFILHFSKGAKLLKKTPMYRCLGLSLYSANTRRLGEATFFFKDKFNKYFVSVG